MELRSSQLYILEDIQRYLGNIQGDLDNLYPYFGDIDEYIDNAENEEEEDFSFLSLEEQIAELADKVAQQAQKLTEIAKHVAHMREKDAEFRKNRKFIVLTA